MKEENIMLEHELQKMQDKAFREMLQYGTTFSVIYAISYRRWKTGADQVFIPMKYLRSKIALANYQLKRGL